MEPCETTILYLVNSVGRQFTIRTIVNQDLDLSNPNKAPDTQISDVTVKGYMSRYKASTMHNTVIEITDTRFFVGNEDTNGNPLTSPSVNDKVIDNSVYYNIELVRPYYLKEDVIGYELTLRN